MLKINKYDATKKRYSNCFETIYDEPKSIGHNRFRGTHYSILRAIVWHDRYDNVLEVPIYHDFAVIWDEDHDERIIEFIEQLYIKGLLHRFFILGEKKGMFIGKIFGNEVDRLERYMYAEGSFEQRLDGDVWSLNLYSEFDNDYYIPNDSFKQLYTAYFSNICLIWNLIKCKKD